MTPIHEPFLAKLVVLAVVRGGHVAVGDRRGECAAHAQLLGHAIAAIDGVRFDRPSDGSEPADAEGPQ